MHRFLQYYPTVFLTCVKNGLNYYHSIIILNCVMCVEAQYLIQYIHFSIHRRFVIMKVAEALLLSLTIVQPHSFM